MSFRLPELERIQTLRVKNEPCRSVAWCESCAAGECAATCPNSPEPQAARLHLRRPLPVPSASPTKSDGASPFQEGDRVIH
jgi:hypothetical protein